MKVVSSNFYILCPFHEAITGLTVSEAAAKNIRGEEMVIEKRSFIEFKPVCG